jgi:hypothetical protein
MTPDTKPNMALHAAPERSGTGYTSSTLRHAVGDHVYDAFAPSVVATDHS